jgi:NADPH:quinone reductase-like Zn-dependent oxidoreductase
MRAAIVRAHGRVPELDEFDDPAPGDGAEVIDVEAAGLNPVDIRIASGQFALDRHEPPYVAGKEGVGRRADGSLVYFDRSREPYGAFAERTQIDAGSGYAVPDRLDPALAVCLGVSGLAAWLGLEWRGRLAYGERVLVLGATGVVGKLAVQAAKLLGAGRVVAAGRDEAALQWVRAHGADAVVRLGRHDDLAAAFRAASGGDGFQLVLDPLWGEPAKAALAALVPYGRLVHVGQSAGADVTLTSPLIRSKPVDLLGYTNYKVPEEAKAAAYGRMARHALAGEIRVEIERLGLEDVPDAWARQGASPHAKLVILP